MGFNIPFITPILTPPGTNARNKQIKGQGGIADIGSGISGLAGDEYKKRQQYSYGFDPSLQSALEALNRTLSASGRLQQAQTSASQLRSNALSRSTPLGFQQNPYMAQAFQMQNLNQATDQGNKGIQQSQSPQAGADALAAFLRALNGYTGQAGQDLNLGANLVYGQPQVPVGKGFMDYISGVIGKIAGSGGSGDSSGSGDSGSHSLGGGGASAGNMSATTNNGGSTDYNGWYKDFINSDW